MTESDTYTILSDAFLAVLYGSGPIMAIALVVGLIIAFFQALTQVQEMTLTFVPKLLAIVAVFWMSMSFMTNTLVGFFQERILPIIAGG